MVTLKNVSVTYKNSKFPVLAGITLNINPGEILSVWGPNGCGKSTLLRLIGGILGEEATVVGEISHSCELTAIGIVPQDPVTALLPWFRPTRNVGIYSRKTLAPEEIEGHLGQFGFTRKEILRRTTQLSEGFQQRLAWACAFLPGENLLILDEPFSNQDREWTPRLMNRLMKFVDAGNSAVLISHEPGITVLASHRIVLLQQDANQVTGVAREVGVRLNDRSFKALRSAPVENYVAELLEQYYSVETVEV